jgi:hypothetical protein
LRHKARGIIGGKADLQMGKALLVGLFMSNGTFAEQPSPRRTLIGANHEVYWPRIKRQL